MSFQSHRLRQSRTADLAPPTSFTHNNISTSISNINRFPSTTSSSASSGYSSTSDRSNVTQYTSASSDHGSPAGRKHKRGQSDVLARARTFEAGAMSGFNTGPANPPATPTRQSVRPLPQAPTASPRSPAQGASPRSSLRHDRGQSIDIGKLSLSQYDGPVAPPTSPPRPLPMRPNSMLLTRSDSILQAKTPMPHGSSPQGSHTTHIGRPDLELLGRSTTRELRTLSRLAESDVAEDFTITSSAQEVVGLRGRRRLQRTDKHTGARSAKSGGYGWEGRNWMDKQRQFLQAYEYLCHIGEAKEWIEDVTQKTLPPIVELEEALRDGVTLANVVEALNPQRHFRVFHHPKLQFRHSDNIAIFFRYLDEVELPDLFRFELIDLYEKKNIPKVIYCVHALSWLLFRKGIVDFRIGNLVGQLEFEHHELEAMQKGLDMLGANMPSFGNMGADFGVPEPEPVETEEERRDRELGENEESIVDLQAQIRGALLRLRLGDKMQQFWDEEHWLIDLQSRIRGDFTRQIMSYRLQMRRSAILTQSAARGFLVRERLRKSDAFWKAHEPEILELQSMIRANQVRDEVRDLLYSLDGCKGPVREIQAVSRGFLVRKNLAAQQQETKKTSGHVERLQALARGMGLRARISKDLQLLGGQAGTVASLQAAARALLTRTQIDREQQQLCALGPKWEALQGAIRGKLVREKQEAYKVEAQKHELNIGQLQAVIRAGAVRREVTRKLDALEESKEEILSLQSGARGMMERLKVAALQQELNRHEARITGLQAQVRGYLGRKQRHALLDELESHNEATAEFQAILKAMMTRAGVDDLLTELEEEEESIVALQAATRGFMVRAKFEEKKRYFNENMKKVIKIQSFVRAKVQGEAYKSLTTGKNPPVNAVKNFVHLLNDSDFDFNEEVEFERMRKTVVQQVRQNEMLEQYIDQLDIKIALLVKNKITLDEVVRHQHNYGGNSMGLLANSTITSANQFDLKALNKSSRKKLESYQQLFFSLQTQPQYLARLFKHLREQGTSEKEYKRIELLVMSLFGYAQKRREEYYLLKLVARAIREEVEGCRAIQEYIRGNYFWPKLLGNYTRSPRDRKYLRSLLGPLIRDNIVEDPALDLESDPMQIYRSAINNEELRTGRPDLRPLDVPREVAIRDPETRRLFIDHLRDLREICDQFFLSLEEMAHKMPYGLRFLSSQMFQALCQHFNREPQENLLQLVANWIWKFYLQPALTQPEQLGVIEKSLSPLQKRNLSEVAKVIGQVASGRPFGGENIYLQPLNNFVTDSIQRMRQILQNLISVADAESTFGVDEFNDLYAKNKPTLYIKMTDVFAIHNLVASELPFMCPTRDDVLREIIQDLGNAKSNENEMNAAGSSDIQMFLTPKLHSVQDPEEDVKSLFMETKRCVLYIIRVQTGANLLEILVKPIYEEDEEKWQTVLHDDFSNDGNTRGAYSDTNMVDVTRMTYYELKRTALENIMRLEQMGRISKQNYYQDVLNAIASDIRTKSRRRVQRQRELEGVRLTLTNLAEKAKYLEQQRKSYDDYIEQAMVTLQNKKGKKKFLLPFTKQYNHQRELERSGRVPKFGSYKYSARTLSEKGVLVSWAGLSDREWDKINITISCDEVGVFAIEGSRGHIQMPGASALVPIEDMLQAQFESHQFMNLFEGNLKLNVNLLLHLVYKKFYGT
ncbi:Ras GTPase-activating-like protein rng2 [Metarhizium brunneum]|uniref:Ras GTPase-activating-like protein rng2 n=1 Tax=Metarhizium brunneum TaxID=500148 RepID=A0A7D5Z9A8_9HYPO